MSIEYTPFLGVGLLLGSYNKVIGFLEHYQLLGALDPSKDDLEYIAQCLGVDIQYFGSDDVYFVGWKTSSDDISHLGLLLEGTKRRWVAKFSKHVPELVHLVDSY